MTDDNGFEEHRDYGDESPHAQLILDLDGFEGPLDVLLTLAREQKVDLVNISILALADQYLDFVARARFMRLEIAADYLVMAVAGSIWLLLLGRVVGGITAATQSTATVSPSRKKRYAAAIVG